MNPNDPLAALQPLREPAAIGAWPPAPGWWMLAALLLAGIAALCWYALRRYRRNRYRRQGLAALTAIEQDFSREQDAIACATAINRVLKTVALQAFPQRDVASLHGDEWLVFLRDQSGISFDPAFAELHYRPPQGEVAVQPLLQQARLWISRHEVTA